MNEPRTSNKGARLHPRTLDVGWWTLGVSAFRSRICAWLAAAVIAHGFLAGAQPTNGPANYSTFSKFISERNIFNPNRYARAANTPYRPRTRPVRRNSFGLAGTMSYDEGETPGIHAFFDGTSADYRKVLQPGGTIGVFKVAAITPYSVTLTQDTNVIVLNIGQQMRDDGQGRWASSTETMNYAKVSDTPRSARREQRSEAGGETSSESTDTSPLEGMAMPPDPMEDSGGPPADLVETPAENTPAEPASPSGPGSDALRRLMELRTQEEQQSGNRN